MYGLTFFPLIFVFLLTINDILPVRGLNTHAFYIFMGRTRTVNSILSLKHLHFTSPQFYFSILLLFYGLKRPWCLHVWLLLPRHLGSHTMLSGDLFLHKYRQKLWNWRTISYCCMYFKPIALENVQCLATWSRAHLPFSCSVHFPFLVAAPLACPGSPCTGRSYLPLWAPGTADHLAENVRYDQCHHKPITLS